MDKELVTEAETGSARDRTGTSEEINERLVVGKRGGGSGNNPNGSETIFRASMVAQRARVLSKPEPQYTEEARRNQITRHRCASRGVFEDWRGDQHPGHKPTAFWLN